MLSVSLAFLAAPSIVAPALGGVGVPLAATPAAAAPCGSPRVHVELPEPSEWVETIPALRSRLLELHDVDPCATVTIQATSQGVLVSVTSGERTASRLVTEPAELVRTVEALVVLPPAVTPPAKVTALELPPVEPAPVRKDDVSGRLELGLGGAVRIGGSPLMVGGGLATFASLVERGWLVGVNARWNFADGFVSAPPPSGFNMDSGAIGVAVGHRWEAGRLAYDALLGPTLVLEDVEAFGAAGESSDGIGGSALDARIDVGLRVSAPASSRIRFYATYDLELSPSRVAHPKQLDPELPPLPAWTSGLALGFLWGTP